MAEQLMTAPPAGGYQREALERYEDEAEWLREQRAAAFEAFERLPLPTTRLEEWRYTDPQQLRWDRVALASLDTGVSCVDRAHRLLAGKLSAGVLTTLGYRVEWQSYPMEHQVCAEEVALIARWLKDRLAS